MTRSGQVHSSSPLARSPRWYENTHWERTRALASVAVSCGTLALLASSSLGCTGPELDFDPGNPARGPSEMLDGAQPITDGNFSGGNDAVPAARADAAPLEDGTLVCDGACRSFCESSGLENPVNQGVCSSLWGVGIESAPIVTDEACRRLWVDTQGRFPTHSEIAEQCAGKPWGEVVKNLIATDDFVRVNRRLWADRLGYDTTAVSVERIYDIDRIVTALYEGRVAYDQFAALVSAHPVLTRRHDTEGDRAEALFWLFLGRPPFGQERSDVARLYHLWLNDYYDHPELGMRLPDAYIGYRCLDELGEIDQATSGECTSVLFGFEQVILQPDARAVRDERDGLKMWSGLLTADEWEKLQAPGRLLSQQWLFWEHAANVVLDQYLGYDLATVAPEAGERLVRYTIDYLGDIRSLHFAVLTSAPYLESAMGGVEPEHRLAYGPAKQVEAEGWVDSLTNLTGGNLSRCDYRLNRPNEFLENGSPFAFALVNNSEWSLNDESTRVRDDYRNLVQTLGGCPDNSQGGRFKIVSVLTTANQLNFAGRLCDPADENPGRQASIEALLPDGIAPRTVVTPELAAQIVDYQMRRFFARPATETELAQANTNGDECQKSQCTAEEFARPACFALLSSAEMMFY